MTEVPKPTPPTNLDTVATGAHRSPEIPPSGEELRALQARFDSVANSPFHKKDGNPRFLTQADQDTGEVITRTVYTFGHKTGSTEYQVSDNEITFIERPDEIGADPTSVNAAPEKQRGFMNTVLHHLDTAQQTIDAKQADQEAYAKKRHAPKRGSRILNALGISGPYRKQMQEYEEMRSKPTYKF